MIRIVSPGHDLITDFSDILAMPRVLERCGRTCYKSEDRICAESAEKFVRMICRNHHESVLEHCSISVRITCSRACSHQLVRHRLASYSQESQRYVNYEKKGFELICPPSVGLGPGDYDKEGRDDGDWYKYPADGCPVLIPEARPRNWLSACNGSVEGYLYELENGKPEDARYLFPNATKTEVVTTMNLRMWRHVIQERALNPRAQWEIRGIFQGIFQDLRKLLPCVFDDLTETV